ncbi:MAG TPA: glycosyltransferase [Alphaproteobacteria bacterium]|jgi:undecaprenyl-phosphate 4-deoxy-4-formamido-L-arabinose transferase
MSSRPFALSIVIPVYNGASTIGTLVDALAQLQVEGGHEIVLVNDGSRDDSAAVCRKLAQRTDVTVSFVNLSRNFGEHNAVMAGFNHVRGDYVINMDDDLQNPPSEVLKLYRYTRDNDYDAVYTRYAEKKHEPWRNLGSRFANWVADRLLDKPKGLYLSSFRCLSAQVVENVVRYQGPYPYVDGLVMQATQSIGSVEVEHFARVEGRSNYTIAKLIGLWLNLFVNFSVVPLRLSVILGFIMSAFGVVQAILVIIEAMGGHTPEGWASLMVAVLLLSGIQLILLGVVGEYLGRVFLTANRKPQFLVRELFRPNESGDRAP